MASMLPNVPHSRNNCQISLQGGSEKKEGGMGGACYICLDNSDANKRNGPG